MKSFWLLGSDQDLAQVGQLVSDALGIPLNERDSGCRGGVYLRGHGGQYEEVIVQANFADDDGSLAEDARPACRTLVYITHSVASSLLPPLESVGIRILRHEALMSTQNVRRGSGRGIG